MQAGVRQGNGIHSSQQHCLDRSPRSAGAISALRRPCRALQAAADVRQQLVTFPADYQEAIKQAQVATAAALADGHKLIEVEFPPTSLSSIAGDGEGQNEMNWSMDYLRKFLVAFNDEAPGIRVFFPDQQELAVARSGQTSDPAAGRMAFSAKFEDNTRYKLGYLTKQSVIWAVVGVDFGQQFSPVQLVKDSDRMFVIAYPSFNPREELSAVYKLWQEAADKQGRPIIIFNGELDRMRGGYYPSLFFPELAKLSSDFIPKFEAAYFLHNFKGTRPGALFRAYPGPWQVLRRNPLDPEEVVVVHTQETRPTLKEVALDILPNSSKRLN